MIDVVYDCLIFPLLSISEFHHAYNSSSTIEMVEEFMFHLVSTIVTLRHKVYVPIKSIPLERMTKLFD